MSIFQTAPSLHIVAYVPMQDYNSNSHKLVVAIQSAGMRFQCPIYVMMAYELINLSAENLGQRRN